jgi:MFS family permease
VLAVAAFVLGPGALADRWGRRRIFLVGVAVMADPAFLASPDELGARQLDSAAPSGH